MKIERVRKEYQLTLFIALVQALTFLDYKSINIKFLTSGHSFMSADCVHASIEKKTRSILNIYDFRSYVEVEKSGKHIIVVPLSVCDFFNFKTDAKLSRMKPEALLRDIVSVKFIKGDKKLYYKTCHSERSFRSMKFIKEKFDLEVLPSCRDIPMGLSHEKKEEIMKLCKMIPLKYLNFWKDLPIECEKDEACSQFSQFSSLQ